jgi:predicted ATPase/class 3 adenylate cyclase
MSDIEGSTRLFHHLGTAYVQLLQEHRLLLRHAIAAHDGREVDTEGDGLLVAFADAAAAVAAALDAQRGLMAHAWPAGGDVRVRIGLHTGEATPTGAGYVSLAVHQVARVSAAAHGGQVLMSETTASAAAGRLCAQARVFALGSFHLRGFPAPQRLFQLLHPDLPSDFPPLRAVGVVPHNLPFLRTGFVGRDRERPAVADLLAATGLVTIAGPGGVGKTRLAMQVAYDVMDRYADGVRLVELAPVAEPERVTPAVAAAVGVADEPGRSIGDVLLDVLAGKAMLLLLDNCEHLLDAVVGLVDELAQTCPHLAVLATSREPLDIDAEAVWRLEPLGTVGPPAGVSDAARLFAERAALVRPDFTLSEETAADVTRLVVHLDGMPLAIELAAAALADRPLSAVLQGLTDRFALLSHGRRNAPSRHRTLRAALDWSLDLLTAEERRTFIRMAAFAGSGSIGAATEVCAGKPVTAAAVPETVRRLIRASLLVAHREVPDRWSMLESVRELASVELAEAGESDSAAARHRAWYAAHTEAVGRDLGRSDRPGAMRDLAAEHENVLLALDTSVRAGDATTALRLAVGMAPFWTSGGHWAEGIGRLDAVLDLPCTDEALRARALVAAGQLLLLRGDLDEAEARFTEACRHGSAAGDDGAVAGALSGAGYVAFRRSRLGDAQANWERALEHAEAAGDERRAAGVLRSLAVAAGSRGDQTATGELLERAMALARRVGDDHQLRQVLGSAAERHLWVGAYDKATEEYGEALELATAIGELPARPLLLAELGWTALLRGDVGVAHRLATEAVELGEDVVNRRVQVHALRLLGETLVRRGRPDDAAAALDRALAVAEEFAAPAELAGVLCSQAVAALEVLRLDEARATAERSLGLSALPHPMRLVNPAWVRGVVGVRQGRLGDAERDFRSIRSLATYAVRVTANGTWGLACVEAARGERELALADHAAALRLRHGFGDRLGVAESLVGIAGVIATTSPEGAARLAGGATALVRASAAVPTPRQQADLDSVSQRATGAADPGTVTDGMTAGATLDECAAVAEALELIDPTLTSSGAARSRSEGASSRGMA